MPIGIESMLIGWLNLIPEFLYALFLWALNMIDAYLYPLDFIPGFDGDS